LQKRFIPTTLIAITILLIGYSCTKFDTTTQGSDLVTIDNINTFADTLAIETLQGIFTNDNTTIRKNENHVIGQITNDPLFGNTEAAIYVQFKPTTYPFYFGNAGDTVKNGPVGASTSPRAGFDSSFICLAYRGAYGDTAAASNIAQTIEVREISDDDFRKYPDSIHKLSYRPTFNSTVIGSAIINPSTIAKNFVVARGRDSFNTQIRIKLDNLKGLSYFSQDSTSVGTNNGFYNDSIFRQRVKGFEIKIKGGTTGNTLYYVNLADAKSRLEFHYHKVSNTGILDTVVQSFPFALNANAFNATTASSSSNFIKREYTGKPVNDLPAPANQSIFLQTSPGTYASIRIPRFAGLNNYRDTNKIIHRAYLIVEQIPQSGTLNNIYTPPPYLYLDLKDSSTALPQRYKPLYFDLGGQFPYNPDATGSSELYHPNPTVDLNNFGGTALLRMDAFGNPFYRYELTVTRYFQHMLSKNYKYYDMRLYAPFNYIYPQYSGFNSVIPYFNPLALGRVEVGSGSNITSHRMRIVVIYSKLP
jgi:hypothetical protein